jgi:hypothetical protein
MNYAALAVSVVVAFVASALYYIVFAAQRARLSPAATSGAGRPGAAQMLAEVLRNLVLALTLESLIQRLETTTWAGAFRLALLLWIGFPVVLLSGSVLYEKVPFRLAAIHAGDWLVKLVLITSILTFWR